MIMERGIQGEEELFERDLDNVEVFERDFQELDELDQETFPQLTAVVIRTLSCLEQSIA